MVKNGFNSVLQTSAGSRRLVAARNSGTMRSPKLSPNHKRRIKTISDQFRNKHARMIGGFSSIYMSRNRRKNWDEQSYTIQAGGRHTPLHPSPTEMMKIGEDKWAFKSSNPTFRRLSVREAARIQTFPDDFVFYYTSVADGYKMVGNAVPVRLAETIARKIKSDMEIGRGEVVASFEYQRSAS